MSLQFKIWIESQYKGIISFDFDSTLTKPEWDHEDELWRQGSGPHSENHDLMKKYATDGYKIIIVTSRNEMGRKEVEEFVKQHKLPVIDVHCTGGEKGSTLNRLGVLIHHDDMPREHEDPKGVYKGEWVKIYHPMDGM